MPAETIRDVSLSSGLINVQGFLLFSTQPLKRLVFQKPYLPDIWLPSSCFHLGILFIFEALGIIS